MKRWIHAAKETNFKEVDGYLILFEDDIVIDVDTSQLDDVVESVRIEASYYPGHKQFASDVADILQNEYKCKLVPRSENGEIVHISESKYGVSLYFDVVYDVKNFDTISNQLRLTEKFVSDVNIGILCGIEFRFSDHRLTVGISKDSTNHVRKEMEHIKKLHPELDYAALEQESLEVSEKDLYLSYDEALQYLRDDFNHAIHKWVDRIMKGVKTGAWDKIMKWS